MRFPGQMYDSETGLHYNYFRTYDPNTGRYITSDPIGLRGGLNTYVYVEGNPQNKIDPTAENPIALGVAAFCLGLGIGDLINMALPPDQYLQDSIDNLNDLINEREQTCPIGDRDNTTHDLIENWK